jgi:hypothetical protein
MTDRVEAALLCEETCIGGTPVELMKRAERKTPWRTILLLSFHAVSLDDEVMRQGAKKMGIRGA